MEPRIQEIINRHYFEQRSPEWLALRENLLTASDVASALGHNRYERPDDLLRKKVLKTAWAGNAATEHGTRLEPVARDLYDAQTGRKTHEIGLVQHPKYPFLGGSADGVTEDGILVEIKCPLTRKIENKVPKHYMPQIQLLLEILDLDVCDFVQYRPGPPDEFMITRVDRDRTWFDMHLITMQKFWDRVLATRENGLCEVETDEKVCEILEDDTVDVPTQAEDADVSRLSGNVLCEVHSA
jgi:putative phage-type endonuclease